MLNQYDCDAQLVIQSLDSAENLLGTFWVQFGCRLIQHQDIRVQCQDRSNDNLLFFPSGQLLHRAATEVSDTECVQRLLHPPGDEVSGRSNVLQTKGDLPFHIRGHKLVFRVLKYHAHPGGQFLGGMSHHIEALNFHFPSYLSSVEMRYQPVEATAQARFSPARRAGYQYELPVPNLEVHIPQGWLLCAGVAEGEILNPNQGHCSS